MPTPKLWRARLGWIRIGAIRPLSSVGGSPALCSPSFVTLDIFAEHRIARTNEVTIWLEQLPSCSCHGALRLNLHPDLVEFLHCEPLAFLGLFTLLRESGPLWLPTSLGLLLVPPLLLLPGPRNRSIPASPSNHMFFLLILLLFSSVS